MVCFKTIYRWLYEGRLECNLKSYVKQLWAAFLHGFLSCNGCHKGYSPVIARLETLTVAMEAIHDKMAHLTEKQRNSRHHNRYKIKPAYLLS